MHLSEVESFFIDLSKTSEVKLLISPVKRLLIYIQIIYIHIHVIIMNEWTHWSMCIFKNWSWSYLCFCFLFLLSYVIISQHKYDPVREDVIIPGLSLHRVWWHRRGSCSPGSLLHLEGTPETSAPSLVTKLKKKKLQSVSALIKTQGSTICYIVGGGTLTSSAENLSAWVVSISVTLWRWAAMMSKWDANVTSRLRTRLLLTTLSLVFLFPQGQRL